MMTGRELVIATTRLFQQSGLDNADLLTATLCIGEALRQRIGLSNAQYLHCVEISTVEATTISEHLRKLMVCVFCAQPITANDESHVALVAHQACSKNVQEMPRSGPIH